MKTEYEKMITGQLYYGRNLEPEYSSAPGRALAQQINQTSILDTEEIVRLEKELFGSTGEKLYVNPPLYVDYGFNIHIGEGFYANLDCVFLDVAPIKIGKNVMFGPRVSLITATHPLDAGVRNRHLELAHSIEIGDGSWLGANVTVNPGVKIGKNTIIGSGSVVTRDIPDNVIAVGNPARILRELTEEDKEFWEEKERDYHEKNKE
ncbi:sugar O-acetyltransferase [Streptococcaceae bacterium ESL0687]|nr:sugar O-acetyltransferase [Streptococcaceae bacterium ESL0687]